MPRNVPAVVQPHLFTFPIILYWLMSFNSNCSLIWLEFCLNWKCLILAFSSHFVCTSQSFHWQYESFEEEKPPFLVIWSYKHRRNLCSFKINDFMVLAKSVFWMLKTHQDVLLIDVACKQSVMPFILISVYKVKKENCSLNINIEEIILIERIA